MFLRLVARLVLADLFWACFCIASDRHEYHRRWTGRDQNGSY